MTKDFQKELKEKVKEGVKPSDLKKLKRSKSAGDVANIPLPPKEPDNKYPYTQLVSQAQEIDELKKETKAKSETIEALEKSPPYPLLAEQLKEKQKEIETLREQLETAHTTKSQFQQELQNELSELDQSLISRGKLLRDWFKEYGKRKELENEVSAKQIELAENIEDATTEIIEQDNLITNLRNENRQLKHTNQSLQRDLKLARQLAELRKNNTPYVRKSYSNDNAPDWLRILIYVSLLVSSVMWLVRERKYKKNE